MIDESSLHARESGLTYIGDWRCGDTGVVRYAEHRTHSEWRVSIAHGTLCSQYGGVEVPAAVLGWLIGPIVAAALVDQQGSVERRVLALQAKLESNEALLLQSLATLEPLLTLHERPVAAEACWHCGDVLLPRARPRCERCPDECDVEGCDAPGCTNE